VPLYNPNRWLKVGPSISRTNADSESQWNPSFHGIKFIEFALVQPNQLSRVGSNPNVIFTRHTCRQCSRMVARSKCRALAFYFSWHENEYVLNLRMYRRMKCRFAHFVVLSKRMWQCSADFWLKSGMPVFGRKIRSQVGTAQAHSSKNYACMYFLLTQYIRTFCRTLRTERNRRLPVLGSPHWMVAEWVGGSAKNLGTSV